MLITPIELICEFCCYLCTVYTLMIKSSLIRYEVLMNDPIETAMLNIRHIAFKMLLHKNYFFLVLTLFQALNVVNGANILYLCGVPSPSHHIWYYKFIFIFIFLNHSFLFNRNSAFANGLAARGHNITVISADQDKNPPNGVHYILIEGLYSGIYKDIIKSGFIPSELNPLQWTVQLADYVVMMCKGNLASI